MSAKAVHRPRAPRSVQVAAALFVGGGLVSLVALEAPLGLRVLQLAVALLIGAYLYRGSRVAWVFAILSAALALATALTENHQQLWRISLSAALGVALVFPSSLRFVWDRAPSQRISPLPTVLRAPVEKAGELGNFAIVRLAQWESDLTREGAVDTQRHYGVLIWRISVALILLVMVRGAIYQWEDGYDHDSPILSVFGGIAWAAFFLTFLALICVLSVAGYTRLVRREGNIK